MQSRFYVKVSNITANYQDQRGKFIVLLRAQLGAADTTVFVRLLDGYTSGADTLRAQDKVKITSTAWKLYSLCTVSIPPLYGLASQKLIQSFRLVLQASRTEGAGDLNADQFILIPVSEGAIHVNSMGIEQYHATYIETRPEDTVSGWTYSDAARTTVSQPVSPETQGPYGFSLPVGQGSTVCAGQRATAHDEGDKVLIYYDTVHRWRTLRGADS